MVEPFAFHRRAGAILRGGGGSEHVDDRKLGLHQLGTHRRRVLRVLRDQLFDGALFREQDGDHARRLDHAARTDPDQKIGFRFPRGIACANDGGERRVLGKLVVDARERGSEQLANARDDRRLAAHRAPADDERALRAAPLHLRRQVRERVLAAVEAHRIARCAEIGSIAHGRFPTKSSYCRRAASAWPAFDISSYTGTPSATARLRNSRLRASSGGSPSERSTRTKCACPGYCSCTRSAAATRLSSTS